MSNDKNKTTNSSKNKTTNGSKNKSGWKESTTRFAESVDSAIGFGAFGSDFGSGFGQDNK